MFGVDGAGLMLSDAEQQLRSVAASDERLQHLEEIQIQHSEGPAFACALSWRILESAAETPPRLQRSSVKADFRPRVSLRFRREDAPWQQSAEIAQRCHR